VEEWIVVVIVVSDSVVVVVVFSYTMQIILGLSLFVLNEMF